MADPLETPEGTYTLEDNLTSDIIDQEAEEDSSLLDAALGDVTTGDNEEVPTTPTDEQADNLLDDTADGVHVEEDPEIEAIKARVKEMEEEAEKLKELQGEAEKQMMSAKAPTFPTPEEKQEMDSRSVHVGNVDYQSTAEELGKHFENCGAINRVTILCDKFTGHPKGFAYVEFTDKSSVPKATELDESLFKGRQIKVAAKRTNTPGISSTNRSRGRGRGRGFRGGYNPYYGGGYMMMPVPPMRGYYRGGRGRAFRGRAKTWYSPY